MQKVEERKKKTLMGEKYFSINLLQKQSEFKSLPPPRREDIQPTTTTTTASWQNFSNLSLSGKFEKKNKTKMKFPSIEA